MIGEFFQPEKLIVASDFDGTIGFLNTESELLRNIGSLFKDLSNEFQNGKIGSKELYRRVLDFIKINRESLLFFIDNHFSIDSGFPLFYEKIRERGWKFVIISDGLKIYIERVLARYNIKPDEIFANEVVFDAEGNLVDIAFVHQDPDCKVFATCKEKIIEDLKSNNKSVPIFYFGDGVTDLGVADKADFLFAKDKLAMYASEKGIPFVNFRNFTNMLSLLGKIRWIVFDLDGVLINSEEAIIEALNNVLKSTGKNPVFIERVRKYIGLPLRDFIKIFSGYVNDDLVTVFRNRFREVYLKKSFLLPYVGETLSHLFNKGYHLGVVTNKKGEYARNLMKHFELGKFFDFIIGEENNLPQKPSGELWEYIFNQKGINPDEVIYVGDAEVDFEFSKAGGVKFASVTTSRGMREFFDLGADIVLNSVKDMMELF